MSVSKPDPHNSHSHGDNNHDHARNNEENNRSHWNENASTYNTRFGKTIDQIISEIQARTDWINVPWSTSSEEDGEESSPPSPINASVETPSESLNLETTAQEPKREVRLLDYACGTGLVSRALASLLTQTIGLDISANMVEQYNTLMLNQGIPSSEMRAVTGNLLSPTDPNPAHLNAPEYFNFDIAAVGMGFHHFTDPTYAAKQLVQRLKPGGVLFIVDFKPHAPLEHSHHHSHDHSHEHSHSHENQGEKPKVDEEEEVGKNAAHTVLHHGFSPETVKKMFEEAGAGKGYEYLEIGDGIVMHGVKEGGEPMKRSLFFARGEKL